MLCLNKFFSSDVVAFRTERLFFGLNKWILKFMIVEKQHCCLTDTFEQTWSDPDSYIFITLLKSMPLLS